MQSSSGCVIVCLHVTSHIPSSTDFSLTCSVAGMWTITFISCFMNVMLRGLGLAEPPETKWQNQCEHLGMASCSTSSVTLLHHSLGTKSKVKTSSASSWQGPWGQHGHINQEHTVSNLLVLQKLQRITTVTVCTNHQFISTKSYFKL